MISVLLLIILGSIILGSTRLKLSDAQWEMVKKAGFVDWEGGGTDWVRWRKVHYRYHSIIDDYLLIEQTARWGVIGGGSDCIKSEIVMSLKTGDFVKNRSFNASVKILEGKNKYYKKNKKGEWEEIWH